MEKLRIFYLKYKHAIPLIIYGIIYMTWFAWLEKNTTGHYRIIHMAADDYIPFCEVFVIPYFLWFAYVSAVVIYFFFKNKEDYYRTCIFYILSKPVYFLKTSGITTVPSSCWKFSRIAANVLPTANPDPLIV